MHTSDGKQNKLATLSYKLKDAVYFQEWTSVKQRRSLHGVLIFKNAGGFVHINGTHHHIEQGKIFVLHANTEEPQLIRFSQPMQGYHLQFYAFEDHGEGVLKPTGLPCAQKISTADPLALQEKAQEILKQQGCSTCWSGMRANTVFQEFIYLLFNELSTDHTASLNQVIRDSRDYIHDHYKKGITRENLAKLAGLHIDYYSRKFKQQYHKSPIAYLNDVRIDHAKRLLFQTQAPIRSVANDVGFSDEFYFSRKFKAKEGYSPTVYVNKIKNSSKITSLNHLVTGHLMALGLEPYAAIMNKSFPIVNRLKNTISVGEQKLDLERLISTESELIVRCAAADQKQTTEDAVFNHIAPTLTLSFQEDWRVHLKTIARFIGREQEAADFLAKYTDKAEDLKRRIQQQIAGKTLLILGIGEGTQCVYGQRNLGTVLYGDLNLSAPAGIEKIKHYKEVSVQELSTFKADKILLTIYRKNNHLPSSQSIRKQLSVLQQSLEWQSMRAVQQKEVYSIFDSKHLYTSYNSLSHDLLLDKMDELLVGQNG